MNKAHGWGCTPHRDHIFAGNLSAASPPFVTEKGAGKPVTFARDAQQIRERINMIKRGNRSTELGRIAMTSNRHQPQARFRHLKAEPKDCLATCWPGRVKENLMWNA